MKSVIVDLAITFQDWAFDLNAVYIFAVWAIQDCIKKSELKLILLIFTCFSGGHYMFTLTAVGIILLPGITITAARVTTITITITILGGYFTLSMGHLPIRFCFICPSFCFISPSNLLHFPNKLLHLPNKLLHFPNRLLHFPNKILTSPSLFCFTLPKTRTQFFDIFSLFFIFGA